MEPDTSDLLLNAGLVAGGGLSLGGSAAIDQFLSNNIKKLNTWENRTKELWSAAPYKSRITGKYLQVSPELADKLLDTYVNSANHLASRSVGPFKLGNIIGEARLLPETIKNLFGTGANIEGDRQHYRMFSDPAADKGKLKAHMLDVAKETDFIDGTYRHSMRQAYNALPETTRATITDSSSIADKYKNFIKNKDKAGIDYLENFILGSSDLHPGAARLVGGGIIGKIDPSTGKLSQEVLHSGFAKNYMHNLKKPLRIIRGGNKFAAGAKGATMLLGLFGLGKYTGSALASSTPKNTILKEASVKEDNDALLNQLLGMAELSGAGGFTAISGDMLANKIKDLLEARKKAPNLNVGFNYGHLPEIGDGHKAPSAHIRQILERYIAGLPDGHELKGEIIRDANGKPVLNEYGFAKRKGGVQFNDLVLRTGGISPEHAKDYNIIYDTGLGAAVPGQHIDQENLGIKGTTKKYGFDNAKKLKGDVGTIKRYVTDTPGMYTVGNIDLPNYGAAVSGPGFSEDVNIFGNKLRGHGFGIFTPQEVIGYGKIRDNVKARSFFPFIPGEIKNIAPDVVGTPFINPGTLDNMNKYTTREQKLGRLSELIDNWTGDADTKIKLSKIRDAIKNGKRIVTIAGSGRGDYVGNRTAHIIDSLDRLGVDNVEVVPLMGGYTGAKNLSATDRANLISSLEGADKKGRITAFGRLNNEPYTLLQQLSDINMATTGQMGVSESASAGNLQFIPETWNDAGPELHKKIKEYQTRAWTDILTEKGKKPAPKGVNYSDIFDASTPELSAWNGSTLANFPEDHPDVFKRLKMYDGGLRSGVADFLRNWGISDDTLKYHNQRIDTDPIAELLMDKNKGQLEELSRKAFDAAKANRDRLPAAHRALAEDMVNTLKANVRKQRIKALPGAVGGALGTGIGLYGMFDGIKRIADPSNYKFNLSL